MLTGESQKIFIKATDKNRDLKAFGEAYVDFSFDLAVAMTGSLGFGLENLYYEILYSHKSVNRHREFWRGQTAGLGKKINNRFVTGLIIDRNLHGNSLIPIISKEAHDISDDYINYEMSNFCNLLLGYTCF